MQRKGRRWPHATPTLTVASYEAIGLLRLVSLRLFPPNWEAGGSAWGYFKTITSRPNTNDGKETTKILAYSLKRSQPMQASIETREKCPESKDATPFILKGDVTITHTLKHSALSGGKPTKASDWTIFLLSR